MKTQKANNTSKFIVDSDSEGMRLDVFLINNISKDISRSSINKHIKLGNAQVNNIVISKAGYLLRSGDEVSFAFEIITNEKLIPTKMEFDIVYEDQEVLVINKPKGLVVHPSAGHFDDTLVNGLLSYLGANIANKDDPVRPGIVHRLDKDTTGLILVTKTDSAHNFLSESLKKREVGREYYAIVRGIINENHVKIDAPLGRDPSDRLKRKVGGIDFKEALTEARVIERISDKYTLLSVKLHTGRTHQIRVHFSHIGYPVVGDPLYGIKNDPYVEEGQFLHAYRLSFVHPTSKKLLSFETPIPEYFETLLKEKE